MHRYTLPSIARLLAGTGLLAAASALAQPPTAVPASGCASPDALAVVTAASLPTLLGKPVQQVRLLHYRDERLAPIVTQIDQRDSAGRFLLGDASAANDHPAGLGPDDEIVFRLSDSAARLPPGSADASSLVEIKVGDSQDGRVRWIYAGFSSNALAFTAIRQTRYQPETDSAETALYKIGFSSQHPFLIDSLQWQRGTSGWSPNVLDAMKIHHQGMMFGFIPFKRTSEDYSSRLTQVKTGPLRVIRRTENSVRIVWQLKTPALYVDYVMMPDSFIMDTIVDIPFNLGLFFSDVETLTTVDWRSAPTLPQLTIRASGIPSGLAVNGQMTDEKTRFNTINDTRFSVHSRYGSIFVQLDIPEDFPIKPWLYLSDRSDTTDPPENQPGQFGNVGYRTTGWENIDTGVHHLKFVTCIIATEAP